MTIAPSAPACWVEEDDIWPIHFKVWQLRHSDWLLNAHRDNSNLKLEAWRRVRIDQSLVVDVATAHSASTCSFGIYISFHFNASYDYKLEPLHFNSMSIIEDAPLSVETPAIPAHDTNTQANTTHHMGAAGPRSRRDYSYTRRYVTK